MVFLRSEIFKRLFAWDLDVYAHAVGIASGFIDKLTRGSGDALEMDVAIEAVDQAQIFGYTGYALHCVVGVAHHA